MKSSVGAKEEQFIWAACVSRYQFVSNYLTVGLAVLKEMSQALAELLSLTLPIPKN